MCLPSCPSAMAHHGGSDTGLCRSGSTLATTERRTKMTAAERAVIPVASSRG